MSYKNLHKEGQDTHAHTQPTDNNLPLFIGLYPIRTIIELIYSANYLENTALDFQSIVTRDISTIYDII